MDGAGVEFRPTPAGPGAASAADLGGTTGAEAVGTIGGVVGPGDGERGTGSNAAFATEVGSGAAGDGNGGGIAGADGLGASTLAGMSGGGAGAGDVTAAVGPLGLGDRI